MLLSFYRIQNLCNHFTSHPAFVPLRNGSLFIIYIYVGNTHISPQILAFTTRIHLAKIDNYARFTLDFITTFFWLFLFFHSGFPLFAFKSTCIHMCVCVRVPFPYSINHVMIHYDCSLLQHNVRSTYSTKFENAILQRLLIVDSQIYPSNAVSILLLPTNRSPSQIYICNHFDPCAQRMSSFILYALYSEQELFDWTRYS